MALQFFDGFDDYGVYSVTQPGSFGTVYVVHSTSTSGIYPNVVTAGAFGGSALGMGSVASGDNNQEWLHPLTTPVSTFIIGARFLFNGPQGNGLGFSFSDTSDNVLVQCQLLQISGISTLSVTVNGSHAPTTITGTLIGSTTYNLLAGIWYELECEVTIGTGTSGSVAVRVNGVTVLSLTGKNTQGTAGSTIGYAGVFASTRNSLNTTIYWDDLYGCDSTGAAPFNTFLTTVAGVMGPAVTTLFPNSNSSVAMTPSTGTNYSNINGSTFQTAAYNSGTAAGQQDLYGLPLPSSVTGFPIGNILAVQTTFAGNENTAGTCSLSSTIESGGTIYQGTTHTMLASPFKYSDIWLVDPATSANWAPAKFNTAGQVFCGAKREV